MPSALLVNTNAPRGIFAHPRRMSKPRCVECGDTSPAGVRRKTMPAPGLRGRDFLKADSGTTQRWLCAPEAPESTPIPAPAVMSKPSASFNHGAAAFDCVDHFPDPSQPSENRSFRLRLRSGAAAWANQRQNGFPALISLWAAEASYLRHNNFST